MLTYDAFVSYSHANDRPLADALQLRIQKLGKPWYKRRALRVFRDDTSLTATPHLWPSIERALSQSKFLILLASPNAAASPWVYREIEFWLASRSIDTILIAITEGMISWDSTSGDFFWDEQTPLPSVLKRRFPNEPRWVDLRSYREEAKKSGNKFDELAAEFAAAIKGIPKEDLLSTELRQQRKALTLALTTASLLFVFACLAVWFGIQFRFERDRAQREATNAIEQRNAAELASGAASEERDRADEALQSALRTANGLVAYVATEIVKIPAIPREYVRDIIEQALKLQEAATRRGTISPQEKMYEAKSLNAAAKALLQVGYFSQALEAVSKSHDILADLSWRDPSDLNVRDELAGSLDGLGDVKIRMDDTAGALAAYNEALAILSDLAKNNGDVAKRHLGYGLVRVGVAELALKGPTVARPFFQQTIDIFCDLEKVNHNTVANNDLAMALDLAKSTIGPLNCR